VAYPSISCALAKELIAAENKLPNYVSVAPPQEINPAAFGPGFLGPQYAPAIVGGRNRGAAPQGGTTDLKLDDLEPPAGVDPRQVARRLELWNALERRFLKEGAPASFQAHHALYRQAADMMRPEVRAAFDLAEESDDVRRSYGGGAFGQGCLLARRLVERGVPFVEVALNGAGAGWDTHQDNFRQVRELCRELDAGWAALMTELAERGLLDSTTILWIGEFGRTPTINNMAGRDHFPAAWSCVFAGGGVRGGQAFGRTSADGATVEENKVGIGDVLATLCAALGVPPDQENVTSSNRPIKIAEGTPIRDILA
jgi:arylsulfatase A-like enzyme